MDERDEYIAALEAENKALKRETEYVKQIKALIPRMVEAKVTREHCSAVRRVIALDKELRLLKKSVAGQMKGM